MDRPHISLVNALVYQRACKMPGAVPFQLQLSGLQEVTGRTGQVRDDLPDLSRVPTNYHQYAEVFSKEMSKQLPPHCLYDLSIQLESEKTLSPRADLLIISTGTPNVEGVHQQKLTYGFHSTIMISLQGASTVCQEERWLAKIMCGLPRTEPTHPKGQIPNSTTH